MITKNGERITFEIGNNCIWLTSNVKGREYEVRLTPADARKLFEQFKDCLFMTGYDRVDNIKKKHPGDLEATNDLEKKLLSGVLKGK